MAKQDGNNQTWGESFRERIKDVFRFTAVFVGKLTFLSIFNLFFFKLGVLGWVDRNVEELRKSIRGFIESLAGTIPAHHRDIHDHSIIKQFLHFLLAASPVAALSTLATVSKRGEILWFPKISEYMGVNKDSSFLKRIVAELASIIATIWRPILAITSIVFFGSVLKDGRNALHPKEVKQNILLAFICALAGVYNKRGTDVAADGGGRKLEEIVNQATIAAGPLTASAYDRAANAATYAKSAVTKAATNATNYFVDVVKNGSNMLAPYYYGVSSSKDSDDLSSINTRVEQNPELKIALKS